MAGPFGLEMGMKTTDFKNIRHCNFDVENIFPELYTVPIVPRPHPMMAEYTCEIAPQNGLFGIYCTSKDIHCGPKGSALKQAFNKLKSQLELKYGKKHIDINRIDNGSPWHKPNDFMMSLCEADRSLVTIWMGALPDNLQFIMLYASAKTLDTGHVSIKYSFNNFNQAVYELSNVNNPL